MDVDVKLPTVEYASNVEYHDAGPSPGTQGDEVVDIQDSAKETPVTVDLAVLYKTANSAVYQEIYYMLEKYFFGDLELPVQAKAGKEANPDSVTKAQQMIDRIITKYVPIDSLVDAAFEDILTYGSAYWEWTVENLPEEGWICPKIYHRDAFSFGYTPSGKTDTDYLIGKYLLGVLQNKKTKEWEFWQTPDPDKQNENILIKHAEENHGLIHFREQRGGAPDGRSYIASIVENGYDLGLSRRRLMQATNRAAGAFMALKLQPEELLGKEELITGMKTSNAAAMKVYYDKIKAHGKKVVQKWSTTTSTLLYPGESIESPPIRIALDPVMVHKYLKTDIVTHFIPRYVTDTEGSSLTSTGESILSLMAKIGKGWRSVLAPFIINFFNLVLEKNGFMDLEIGRCKWPQIETDDKEMVFSQAMASVEQAIIPRSRFLKIMGWDQLTKDEQAELEEYWKFRQENGVT